MAANLRTIDVPIQGMDCAECTRHVQEALAALPGVTSVTVLLAAEKAIVQLDPSQVDLPRIYRAIERAGYAVPAEARRVRAAPLPDFSRQVLRRLGLVVGAALLVVLAGEWLGWFDLAVERLPWPVWAAIVLVGGYPIFQNVIRATRRGQVISHTLMTLGTLAAIAVGQWATAVVVVVFMRLGDYVERFTAERGRQALRDLTALAPQTARVEREGSEVEVPVETVSVGEIVVVRPGERIPVDGEVVAGQATVNQAPLTGESLPVEVGPGSRVYAATVAQLGSLRLRVTRVGAETTFGRVIALVAEAEANRGNLQRLADRFSGWYLPVVVGIAALTFLLRRDPLATAAVLVVACSCSFALATPIALLASIGASARRGVLVKGGRYLEALARADVLLIDKTGTLTLGRPRITDVVPRNGVSADEVLALAAAAERYSEHPLAEAVRAAARARGLPLAQPDEFVAVPGQGVRARVAGQLIVVGRRAGAGPDQVASPDPASALEASGKTVVAVSRNGELIGLLAAADTLRPEVPAALAAARRLGIGRIEMLTGDNERVAATLARDLEIDYRANLLPDDKIAAVRKYQARGHTVVMVGDGVNDAPALVQADVGIGMPAGTGGVGRDLALEVAPVVLLRDDWALVPEVLGIARRTMSVVRLNLAFTVAYNLIGLSLAALGVLPPVVAAAAQSLPDLGILGNSVRLLRPPRTEAPRSSGPGRRSRSWRRFGRAAAPGP